MEREKNYVKIENRDFHNILNEVREEVLYNKPLYEIIVARIKRFKHKMLCRKVARKLTRRRA